MGVFGYVQVDVVCGSALLGSQLVSGDLLIQRCVMGFLKFVSARGQLRHGVDISSSTSPDSYTRSTPPPHNHWCNSHLGEQLGSSNCLHRVGARQAQPN